MAADLPKVADDVLAESGKGAADEQTLKRRLEALTPEHPSSIADASAQDSGSDGPDVSNVEEGQEIDERHLTDIEHTDHVAKIRDHLAKASVDGMETKVLHTTDSDHEQWSEERAVMHDEIIADFYEAAHDVPCDGKAILAGGLPGAGKTTVLEQHARIDRSQYLTINPDAVKEEMAKRGMMPQVEGLTPMEASELGHEESSYIAKQLALRAMQDRKNVIWDITMSSAGSTQSRISDLRDFGYSRVDGIFVDIPLDTSIQRADARHRLDHDSYRDGQGLGGRYVAPEIIKAQADEEWGSKNRKTFEQIKPELDDWIQYDNSVNGRAAVLVDSNRMEEE